MRTALNGYTEFTEYSDLIKHFDPPNLKIQPKIKLNMSFFFNHFLQKSKIELKMPVYN